MKRLVLLLIITSLALAQCVNNGICEPSEKPFGCSDCSFGSVCVGDGVCTSVEQAANCPDCSTAKVVKCVNDGVCSNDERELGDCQDCQPKSMNTGLLLLAGGIGLLGFFIVGAIVLVIVAVFAFQHFGNRRIRM